MERTKLVRQIILCVKELKEEANALFASENIIPNSDLMIEEFFMQKFTPYILRVKNAVKGLPSDEYMAIELDAWLKVLRGKCSALQSSDYTEEYAEVLYIKQQFYPKLMDVISDLKLEVLEGEFDARTDSSIAWTDSKIELGPNTLVVTPSVISALVSLLYNFNILQQNQSIQSICAAFASVTGYSGADLEQYLNAETQSGRLVAKIDTDDLRILHKLLRSMTARTEYVLSYND